jgi:cyclohexa-1,5-dienecarbonyl-CoA hydratase
MPETEAKGVVLEKLDDGKLVHLTLDAGKGNVISGAVIAELREAATSIAGMTAARAVIIDHTGKHFSFGASVPEHVPGQVEKMLPALHGMARELLALDLPILVAVRGFCLGGGLELALLGDRIFAAPGAGFGQPELNLGVFAPIGSALLPRAVGSRNAADLLLSGRTIKLEEARSMGLVQEEAEDPAAAALSWAREHLVPKSAAAMRLATRAARSTWLPAFLTDLDRLEGEYLGELMGTHDAVEGLTAFLEKREACWEDR